MLAITSVNNEEKTVYTCPTGKSAYVFVDIYCSNDSQTANVTIKVNDTIYYKDTVDVFVSAKLSLTANDVIKVSTTETLNVFVHGMEV